MTLFKGNHPIPSDKANTLLERAAELSGIRGYVIAAASFSVAAGVMLLRVSFSLYSNLTGISLMIAEIGVLALSSVGSGRKR